jgi:hypothetical protein
MKADTSGNVGIKKRQDVIFRNSYLNFRLNKSKPRTTQNLLFEIYSSLCVSGSLKEKYVTST